MKQVGIVFVCACLWAAGAEGQTGPTGSPARPASAFRSGVDLITLDVTVLNAGGQQVGDLAPPEFTVRVDGQPRRVVSAQYIRSEGNRPSDAGAASYFTSNAGASRGRLVVIAVDQAQIRAAGARPVLTAAERFLQRLSPMDRVAFASMPAPGTFVDFTTDHSAIRAAMEQVVGQAQTTNGRLGMSEAVAITERRNAMAEADVINRECLGLEEEAMSRCRRDIADRAQEMVVVQRAATSRSLDSLRGLLTNLAKVEGQKTLLFISEGLQMDGLGGELDDIADLAATAGVSIDVLLLDATAFDVSVGAASPTDREDRNVRAEGLARLALQARGGLHRVVGNGEAVFERLLGELSGYYLLGVEPAASDRDGRRHRVEVSVGRSGVAIRSRQAFVYTPAPASPQDGYTSLAAALRAPYQLNELPLKVTTFVYRDKAAGRVRLILAADVGQLGQQAGEYTLGFIVVDGDNRVVADAVEQRHLRASDGAADAPLNYSNVAIVAPGSYTLRFGAVDASGRRGTVFRTVKALPMSGQELALGDLLLGSISAKESISPSIEARIQHGELAAYMELYSTSAAILDQTSVRIEIATDEATSALLVAPAAYSTNSQPTHRVAQAIIRVDLLPPGRYVARAVASRGGKALGPLTRPFVVLPSDRVSPGRTSTLVLPDTFLGPPPKFDKTVTLRPEVLGLMFDLVEQATPALKTILAGARNGRLVPAAIAALEAGHQDAASFLRALDLLNKGDLDKAANLLHLAAGARRDFFPAAFYLGVCYAAAGRDRDAAGVWQMAIGTTPRPPIAYALLVDARWREGQLAAVVDILREAYQRVPNDDGVARRLALVYAVMGLHADAVPIFDRYLARHPADQDVLFAAVLSTYEAGKPGGPDAEKLARYAGAYTGPQKALVSRYLEAFVERQARP